MHRVQCSVLGCWCRQQNDEVNNSKNINYWCNVVQIIFQICSTSNVICGDKRKKKSLLHHRNTKWANEAKNRKKRNLLHKCRLLAADQFCSSLLSSFWLLLYRIRPTAVALPIIPSAFPNEIMMNEDEMFNDVEVRLYECQQFDHKIYLDSLWPQKNNTEISKRKKEK